MNKCLLIFCLLPFALVAQIPKSIPFEEKNQQRINEIAGYLEENRQDSVYPITTAQSGKNQRQNRLSLYPAKGRGSSEYRNASLG